MKKYFICLCAGWLACGCGQEGQPLNVATYNLRMDTPADSGNAWQFRRDNVRALIEYHNFDIVGTQEGFEHQLQDLCRTPQYAYLGAGRDDGRHAGEHSAIIYKKSRLEPLDSGNFWLSQTPDTPSKGWDALCCNRICSWAKFRDKTQGGRVFFVFNVHFDHEGRVARRESGKLMTEKIKAIAQGAPAICTGDFNSADTTEQIGLLAAFMSDARTASVAKPYGVRGTFTTRFANPIQERIDYIFVSSHFRTAKYAVLTDNNGAYYPSDHLPVAVELLWE